MALRAGPEKLNKRARILKRKSNPTKRLLAELAATGSSRAGAGGEAHEGLEERVSVSEPSVSSEEVRCSLLPTCSCSCSCQC